MTEITQEQLEARIELGYTSDEMNECIEISNGKPTCPAFASIETQLLREMKEAGY